MCISQLDVFSLSHFYSLIPILIFTWSDLYNILDLWYDIKVYWYKLPEFLRLHALGDIDDYVL